MEGAAGRGAVHQGKGMGDDIPSDPEGQWKLALGQMGLTARLLDLAVVLSDTGRLPSDLVSDVAAQEEKMREAFRHWAGILAALEKECAFQGVDLLTAACHQPPSLIKLRRVVMTMTQDAWTAAATEYREEAVKEEQKCPHCGADLDEMREREEAEWAYEEEQKEQGKRAAGEWSATAAPATLSEIAARYEEWGRDGSPVDHNLDWLSEALPADVRRQSYWYRFGFVSELHRMRDRNRDPEAE